MDDRLKKLLNYRNFFKSTIIPIICMLLIPINRIVFTKIGVTIEIILFGIMSYQNFKISKTLKTIPMKIIGMIVSILCIMSIFVGISLFFN